MNPEARTFSRPEMVPNGGYLSNHREQSIDFQQILPKCLPKIATGIQNKGCFNGYISRS
jgi:hypothetical protein